MRRIQIYIDEQIDEQLQAEAALAGRSKASLIRELVARHFNPPPPISDDPITNLIGTIDIESEDIDEIVYGS